MFSGHKHPVQIKRAEKYVKEQKNSNFWISVLCIKFWGIIKTIT